MKKNLTDYPNISKCNELNSRVWQSATFPSELTHKEIFLMQKRSKDLGIRQFRYCLHNNNDDLLQQMIIFHNYPQAINWHLQLDQGIVFYQVIKGQVDIVLSNNKKKIIHLSEPTSQNDDKFSTMVSVPKNIYRRIITNSRDSIFLEITNGSFCDSKTLWKTSIN